MTDEMNPEQLEDKDLENAKGGFGGAVASAKAEPGDDDRSERTRPAKKVVSGLGLGGSR